MGEGWLLMDQPLVAEYSPATDDEFRRDVAHVGTYEIFRRAERIANQLSKFQQAS
jgi:hypothetical protein